MDDLQCDIESIFANRDFSTLEKLSSIWSGLCSELSSKIEDRIIRGAECAKQQLVAQEKLIELQNEYAALKSATENTILNQKVLVKKIMYTIKEHNDLQNCINTLKIQRDNLSLDIVDLQHEKESRNENMKMIWDSFKKGFKAYKENLDIHVKLMKSVENVDGVKVSFFIMDEATMGKYYTYLEDHNNKWKVVEIQPELKEEHQKYLEQTTDFSKAYEVDDITAFLYHLRDIFLKYYL